jgi:predicted O-methyltransferase YrrM
MVPTAKKRGNYRPLSGAYYKRFRKFILPVSVPLGLLISALYFTLGNLSYFLVIPLFLALIMYLALEIVHQVSLMASSNHQYGIQHAQSISALYHILDPALPLPSMAKWAGNPDFCALVAKQIISSRPSAILEIGSGVSTVVAGLALKKTGGMILSIDHDDRFYLETEKELNRHDLSDIARVHHSPLSQIDVGTDSYLWYELSFLDMISSIDLLIVDGPPARNQKHSRYPALPLLHDKLSENAVIILDDGRRQDEREIAEMWAKNYDLEYRFVETEKGAFVLSRSITR